MPPLPLEESNDFSSSISNEQVIASSESSVTFSLSVFLLYFSFRIFIVRVSTNNNSLFNTSPISRIIFSTSLACSEPIIPGNTPKTPASAQFGANSGGGAFGNKSL